MKGGKCELEQLQSERSCLPPGDPPELCYVEVHRNTASAFSGSGKTEIAMCIVAWLTVPGIYPFRRVTRVTCLCNLRLAS